MGAITGPPQTFSSGELTNPADESVVATTGPIYAPGVYEVLVTANVSATAQFRLEHRSVANGSNIDPPIGIYILANTPGEFRQNYYIYPGERVQVVMDDALTGTAFVAINLRREANSPPVIGV